MIYQLKIDEQLNENHKDGDNFPEIDEFEQDEELECKINTLVKYIISERRMAIKIIIKFMRQVLDMLKEKISLVKDFVERNLDSNRAKESIVKINIFFN